MGYGAIVNHAPSKDLQNAEIRSNQKPKRNAAAGQVVYYFIKDIKKDEEILASYGKHWGNALEWAAPRIKIIDETEDVWQSFLKLNVYNLGILMES